MSDLEKMIPTEDSLFIKGENLVIKPILVSQLSATIAAAGPLMAYFKKLKKADSLEGLDLYAMVSENSEHVIHLIQVLSGKPRTWIDGLNIQELVEITAKLVEANLDFFIKSVLPAVLQVMARVQSNLNQGVKQTPTPGLTSSSNSSETGTGTQTS